MIHSTSQVFGLIESKHFTERYNERIGDPRLKNRIMFHIDRHMCEMVFDIACTPDNRKVFNILGRSVVCMIDHNRDYPRLLLKTIYKQIT